MAKPVAKPVGTRRPHSARWHQAATPASADDQAPCTWKLLDMALMGPKSHETLHHLSKLYKNYQTEAVCWVQTDLNTNMHSYFLLYWHFQMAPLHGCIEVCFVFQNRYGNNLQSSTIYFPRTQKTEAAELRADFSPAFLGVKIATRYSLRIACGMAWHDTWHMCGKCSQHLSNATAVGHHSNS